MSIIEWEARMPLQFVYFFIPNKIFLTINKQLNVVLNFTSGYSLQKHKATTSSNGFVVMI